MRGVFTAEDAKDRKRQEIGGGWWGKVNSE
jgi:hypothetical protein